MTPQRRTEEGMAASRRCSRRCRTSGSSTARTVVIKYGGAAMRDEALRDDFATDVVLLKYVGLNPVIVHGGGPDITTYMERLGMEVRFVEGVRVSDPETVEVAKMVLLGKVNSDIVMRLNRHGQPAVGLSGEDGDAVRDPPARRTPSEVGFVGEIERVDGRRAQPHRRGLHPGDRLGRRRRATATPTTSTPTPPPARSPRRCGAYKAIFLTDVAGWLADPDDPTSLNSRATVDEVEAALAGIAGGMRPKLAACVGGDPRRRRLGAHHRRPPPAQPAARAVHRRRHRHDGHAVSVRQRAAGARGALRDDTYARAPVEFVRGEGARLWDVRRQGVPRLLRRALGPQRRPLPPADRRRDHRAGRRASPARSNLFYSEPAMRLASGSPSRASAAGSSSATRATEASECAIKLVRKHAHARGHRAAGDRHPRRRLSRPHARRAGGDAEARPRGPLRPAAGGASSPSPRDDPQALRDAVGERTAAVMIEPIQGEAGIFPIADEVLVAAREACDARGRRARLRRGPVRDGEDRDALGLRAAPGAPRRADGGEGARRRPAGRRRASPRRSSARCSARGDHGSTFAGAPVTAAAALAALDVIDDAGAARRGSASSASACATGSRSSTRSTEVRGRGLMVGRHPGRGHRRRRGRRAGARGRPGDQRPGRADAALPAAAGDRARPTSTGRSRSSPVAA